MYQIFLAVFWKIDDFINTFWLYLTFIKSQGNSYKAPASASKAGGYTMYSREKYPTSALRRNLVEVEDSNEIYGESIYDTDYKYFLINK